jgi:sortase A
VRALAFALILIGALALLDAAVTLVWQEPFSAIYASVRQHDLAGALARAERAPVAASERRALGALGDERLRIAYLARALERTAREGSAVGRIEIPRIHARFVVVKGTRDEDLRGGPGIFGETTFPGIPGTTAIAGHRTTYLAPFRHIDALRAGDAVVLEMPYARFTYTVISSAVVPPNDVNAAVARVGYSRVVLSACAPLFSAAKRLLVFARLQTVEPGAALRSLTTSARSPVAAPANRQRPEARRPRARA